MGASSRENATVRTYTEVSMDEVRPDGLIEVRWGQQQVFTALVEVKTRNNKLDRDQLKRYLRSARDHGYQHLITISNEIAPPGELPVQGLGIQANSRVKVTHLSWSKILSTALRLKNHIAPRRPKDAPRSPKVTGLPIRKPTASPMPKITMKIANMIKPRLG